MTRHSPGHYPFVERRDDSGTLNARGCRDSTAKPSKRWAVSPRIIADARRPCSPRLTAWSSTRDNCAEFDIETSDPARFLPLPMACLRDAGGPTHFPPGDSLPMATTGNADIRGQLEEILSRRIMILDGSMGALIYTYQLSEEDVRGQRFARHSHRHQELHRSPGAHPAQDHRRHPSRLPRSRRRHHRDRHVQRHRGLARGVRAPGARLRDEQDRGRARPPGGRRVHPQEPRQAAVRRRQHRPDQEAALDGHPRRRPRPARRRPSTRWSPATTSRFAPWSPAASISSCRRPRSTRWS